MARLGAQRVLPQGAMRQKASKPDHYERTLSGRAGGRYIHTTVDGSLQDSGGHHNSALFVQWVRPGLAQGRCCCAVSGVLAVFEQATEGCFGFNVTCKPR